MLFLGKSLRENPWESEREKKRENFEQERKQRKEKKIEARVREMKPSKEKKKQGEKLRKP